MGPVYYQKLKHMVLDKVGPKAVYLCARTHMPFSIRVSVRVWG